MNPRAGRKSPSQWANLKGTICSLYATHTLERLIEVLNREYNFRVSKRQLVYRLNLWRCRKYNIGDAEGDIDGDAVRVKFSKLSIGPRDAAPVTPVTPVSNADGLDSPVCHDEAKCARARAILDGCPAQRHIPWDVQIADVLLAVCNTKEAWEKYSKINDGGLEGITSLSRTAETQSQCHATLDLLEHRIYQAEGAQQLYLLLLYTFVCDTLNCHFDEMEFLIITAVSSLLEAVDGFFIRPDGSLDMVAYILLDNFGQKHHHLLTGAQTEDLKLLLYRFDDWILGVEQPEPSPPVQVLRRCAEWCHQQLLYITENPESASRPAPGVPASEYHELWKGHVEVFGALWHRLAMQHISDGGVWPGWAGSCVETLNLSHAEVLSCVCWVILKSPAGQTVVPGGQEDDDDDDDDDEEEEEEEDAGAAARLFAGARKGAHDVVHRPATALWEAFRDAFVRFNTPAVVADGPHRAFREIVMEGFRMFVEDTLGDGGGDGGTGGIMALGDDWMMLEDPHGGVFVSHSSLDS